MTLSESAMAADAKSSIFAAVHATAADLHRLGFIDLSRMQKYDTLCLQSEPITDAEKIQAVTNCEHL